MTRRGGQAIIVGVPGFDVTMEIPTADGPARPREADPGLLVRRLERPARRAPTLVDALHRRHAHARRARLPRRSSSTSVNEAFDGHGQRARSPAPSSSTASDGASLAACATPFGHSDLVVSEVGFGTWTLVSDWWGVIDDKHGMIQAALDAGINFIDTAPVYGDDGVGETLLADVPQDEPRRDRPHHEVRLRHRRAARCSPASRERPHDWDPSSIRAAARRLAAPARHRLHRPATSCTTRASSPIARRRAVGDARRAARPRARSASSASRSARRSAGSKKGSSRSTTAPIATLQTVFNILEQEPGLTFATRDRRCAAASIGLIARVPHASDTLSGKVTRDTVFPPEDHRSHRNRDNMLDNFDKAETLAFLWEGTGRTIGQAAIAGILANPAFATVLPTVRRRRRGPRVRARRRSCRSRPTRSPQLDELWARELRRRRTATRCR